MLVNSLSWSSRVASIKFEGSFMKFSLVHDILHNVQIHEKSSRQSIYSTEAIAYLD